MRKKKKISNNINDDIGKSDKDRYLITYADLLTLLLALFAILYASSQVDMSKYKEVASSFATIFSGKKSQDNVILNANMNGIPPPVVIPTEEQGIALVKKHIEEKLKFLLDDRKLNIEPVKNGFKIVLNTDLLFKSGSADLKATSVDIIDSLASVLKTINRQINIDGHTDGIPMRSMRYESNWHLSAARAMNVAYMLINKNVPEHNLVIRAFGGQRPVSDNTSEEGRKKNRRVDIVITDKDISSPRTIANEEQENNIN